MLLAVALPASAAIQADKVEIRGEVLDEKIDPANFSTRIVNFEWNASNFAGFWFDLDEGLSSETMTLNQTGLDNESNTIDDQDTTGLPRGGLYYDTVMMQVRYDAAEKVDEAFNTNTTIEEALDCTDGKPNQCYGKIGWLAEEYVALNGKAKKLTKLIYEQGTSTSDKETLTIGTTWDVGGGWTLSAESIDVNADPRQAWLVLSYNGVKVDDKVVKAGQSGNPGEIYTYTTDIGGETDVPLFVTYIDSIFSGVTSDMVQLRYTWAVSKSVSEVKSGDKYGVFEVKNANDTMIQLNLDSSISLTADSTQDLAGNFKLKVADDEDALRFYPMVEYEILEEGVTPTRTPGVTPGATPGVTAGVTAGMTPETNVTVATPPEEGTPAAETTAAEAKATPTEPGFEAIFAIAGLLALAFLVLRQRK